MQPELKIFLEPTKQQLERLKKKNAKFDKLSKKKQRIKIAEDVITSLKIGRYRPASTYFELGDHGDIWLNPNDEWSFVDASPTNLGKSSCQVAIGIDKAGCTVCGIGSIFAAATENHDKISFKKLFVPHNAYNNNNTRSMIVSYLKTWFSITQLNLIEDYYEGHYPKNSFDGWQNGNKIKTTYSDKKRMIKIMENIISNDGQFDPDKGRHANTKAYQKMMRTGGYDSDYSD